MVHNKAGFLRFLVLLLGFSFVLSSIAVPSTRSLKSPEESVQDDFLSDEDAMDLTDSVEPFDGGKGYIRGRMDTATTNDYPGTGANPHHDPKTPGAF